MPKQPDVSVPPQQPEAASQPEITPTPQPEAKTFVPANAFLTERAEKIVLAADIDGISMENLYSQLRTTMIATKQAVADSPRIVSVAGKLIHEEAFVDWEDGANQMEKILDKLLAKNNGYVSAAQLYEYVHADMQMFLNDNNMDDTRAVYDLAQHLFEKVDYHGKHLVFQSKTHISRGETAVTTNLDIMRNFAREQGGFFVEDELEEYLKSVGIKTNGMRTQMQIYSKPTFLFYAPRTFITAESIGFDDAWFATAQKALDNLFADMGDHVVLRDIQPWWYTQLPALPGCFFLLPQSSRRAIVLRCALSPHLPPEECGTLPCSNLAADCVHTGRVLPCRNQRRLSDCRSNRGRLSANTVTVPLPVRSMTPAALPMHRTYTGFVLRG